MSNTSPVTGQPYGVQYADVEGIFFNRTGSAVAIGDVLQIDLGLASTEATTNVGNGSNSGKSNLIAVTAVVPGTQYVVAMEAIADNAAGKCKVVGEVDAFIVNGDGDTGDTCTVVATTNTLDATVAANEAVVAKLLEDPASDTKTLTRVLFDGTGGLGGSAA